MLQGAPLTGGTLSQAVCQCHAGRCRHRQIATTELASRALLKSYCLSSDGCMVHKNHATMGNHRLLADA